jgi:hypothetical protein
MENCQFPASAPLDFELALEDPPPHADNIIVAASSTRNKLFVAYRPQNRGENDPSFV